MSEVIEFEDTVLKEDKVKMGSLYHSAAQANLTGLLLNDERFTVFVELSLDTSQVELSQFGVKTKQELQSDVCVYVEPPIEPQPPDDVLRVSQMPVLTIEILSPEQKMSDIFAKFKAYFALGIKSCWLVIPSLTQISVYSNPNQHKTFDLNNTEVIDEIMDIRLPIQKVFKRILKKS